MVYAITQYYCEICNSPHMRNTDALKCEAAGVTYAHGQPVGPYVRLPHNTRAEAGCHDVTSPWVLDRRRLDPAWQPKNIHDHRYEAIWRVTHVGPRVSTIGTQGAHIHVLHLLTGIGFFGTTVKGYLGLNQASAPIHRMLIPTAVTSAYVEPHMGPAQHPI